VARHQRALSGTVVLDCEGLSRYISDDKRIGRIIDSAPDCVISVATMLEATNAKVNRARWNFVLSELHIEPFTVELAKEASELLRSTGLHGHKYAIDAMVAVTAMRQPGPVVLLTSDIDDMSKLCGKRIELVEI
jgi:hypothetical protein